MSRLKDNRHCRRDFLKTGAATAASALAVASVPKTLFALSAGEKAKNRWAMVIDLRRCVGCLACAVACKSEFHDPLGRFRSTVQQLDKGTYPAVKRYFIPVLCNHCENPPCTEACPVDPVKRTFEDPSQGSIKYEGKATYKRPDGVVLVDESICVGCGMCIEACPYGARFFHPLRKAGGAPENNTIGKCTFCSFRAARGVVPSCVNTCPGRARIFGDLNDPGSPVSKLLKENKTQILLPKEGTEPNVYYVGLEPGTYTRYANEEGFHNEIK